MRSQLKFVVGLCFAAVLVLGSANPVLAQGRGPQQTPAEQKAAFDANFASLTTSLALTEEQGPKVKEILWTAQEKRTEMMAAMRGAGGGGGAGGGMREKMTEMNKATLTSLAGVLTPEQIKKYEEIQAAQQAQRAGRGRPQGQGR